MRNKVAFARIQSDGFSLLEVLISLGVLGLVAVATATLMAEQNKQIKHMSQKIVINDVKNALISTMQNVGACGNTLLFTGENAPSFDSTLVTNKSMSITRIRVGQGVSSPVLLENNMEIAPGSRLFVNSIILDELTSVGGGKWSGIWKIDIRNDYSSFIFKPITLNPQLFDVDTATDPAVARVTACVAVTGGAGGQWDSLNAIDIFYTVGKVGIGTTSPLRPFHVAVNDPGTPSLLSIENTNTTNSNGANISFRGTTTGSGASSFKEFAAIQSTYSVHDNATMASSLKFWTAVNGSLNERMRIDTSGRIGIGTSAPTEQLEITGNFKLPVSTTSVGLIKQGANNLFHTIGTQSQFFGVNSGPLANTGSFNTAVGYSAMSALTSGRINTAVGHRALEAVTTGEYNTSFGAGALDANTTGGGNTAIGANAMNNNIVGSGNAYIGDSAGARTEGNDNAGIGNQANYTLVTGNNNSAIGKDSGAGLITGSNNTFLGALVTSADNLTNATAIGYASRVTASNSLILGGTGASAVNVGIGTTAPTDRFEVVQNFNSILNMRVVNTDAGNAARSQVQAAASGAQIYMAATSSGHLDSGLLKPNAGALYSHATNGISVGGSGPLRFYAGGGTDASLRLRIDTAGRVGIGPVVPVVPLQIVGDYSSMGTFPITTANANVRLDEGIGSLFLNGTAVISNAASTGLAIGTNVAASLFLGTNNSKRVTIDSVGRVGIGTSTPGNTLEVNGTIAPSGNGVNDLGSAISRFKDIYATNAVINTSDARLKDKIQETDLGLDFINFLKPVSYVWKHGAQSVHYGLIAQDVKDAIISAKKLQIGKTELDDVIVSHDRKSDSFGVRYTELISPIIKAIQEIYSKLIQLKAEVDVLMARNQASSDEKDKKIIQLEQENKIIKARLEKIEAAMASK